MRYMTQPLTPSLSGDLAAAITNVDARLIWEFIDADGDTAAIGHAYEFMAEENSANATRIAARVRRYTEADGQLRRLDWMEL